MPSVLWRLISCGVQRGLRFFREILTIFACLLVLALSVALAGPYLVDWNQRRSYIEATLSEVSGGQVRIAGDIDIKLLPTPRLVLAGVSLRSAAPDAAIFYAQRIQLEIAPMALLRGDIRFTDAQIDKPEIHATLAVDGSFALPTGLTGHAASPLPAQIAFENIVLRQGRLRLDAPSSGGALMLEDVSFEISAQSLAGPWRGAGSVRHGQRRVPFYFNTGVADGDRVRIKLAVEKSGDLPQSEFDGALIFGTVENSGVTTRQTNVVFEGQSKISGVLDAYGVTTPWEITGPLRADMKGVALAPLVLRSGGVDRTFSANGEARYIWGQRLGEIALETPRIDADYLSGAQARSDTAMRIAGDVMGSLLDDMRNLPQARLSLKSPALTLGGETLADLSLVLTPQDSQRALLDFRSGLPGRAAISLKGEIEGGSAARFLGTVNFEARDLDRLAQWASHASPAIAAQMAALPFQHLEFDGQADVSAAGFFAREAAIVADRSRFHGLINLTRAAGSERARAVFNLSSPALDLDHLPDLTPLMQAASDADFSVSLDARAVRLARVGQGMIDAGRIVARVTRQGNVLDIEQFDIARLGGASFNARGQFGDEAGQIEIRLDAERLVELGALLQRIAPGVWSDALVRRAVSLSPANLTFSARTQRRDGAVQLAALSVDGTARGTRLTGNVTPGKDDANQLSARISLVNSQTPMLLRQFGLDTVAIDRMPAGRLDIESAGQYGSGFETRAKASLAGVTLNWQGRVNSLLPFADLRGDVKIESADASPLLQILALALPDALSRAPVDLSGQFSAVAGRYSLANIEGLALGSRVAGMMVYGAEEKVGASSLRKLTGDLRLDSLSLEGLGSLILGPRPPVKSNAIWPDMRFAPAVADPPVSEILINAGRVLLPNGVYAESARFNLALAPGLIAVSAASFKLGGGQGEARVSIRRDGANVSADGQIVFDGPVTMANDFSGRAKGLLDFAGTGSSYASIISGLAGRGRLNVTGLRIAAADETALARVIESAQDLADVTEAKISAALSKELARSARLFDAADFDLSLASGTIAFAKSDAPVNAGNDRLSGSFDVRSLNLDAELKLSAPPPEDWNATAPEAYIRWQGPLPATKRYLNMAALVNGLGVRAIEREAARIEMIEYDARERAAFNRRNRAHEFLQQREIEIAAFQIEQERRVAEERRRAEEEARRKTLEEQRNAARRAAAEAELERREKERSRQPVMRELPANQPLQLTPQTPAPVFQQPSQPAPLSDPAASGRY